MAIRPRPQGVLGQWVPRSRSGPPAGRDSALCPVRALLERALGAGMQGILSFTLPEALWLAGHGFEDIVVAYPTVDRRALRDLAGGPARERVTLMVDCVDHLDAIPPGPVRVCVDVDAGWWPLG